MPHGFLTIEQRTTDETDKEPHWVAVEHLDSSRTLSDAIRRLEEIGKPGFYRINQMQRMVSDELYDGKPKLRQHHAATPEELERAAEANSRKPTSLP